MAAAEAAVEHEEESVPQQDFGEDSDGYYCEATPCWQRPLRDERVRRAWNRVAPAFWTAFAAAERTGQWFADALGITQSRFQYAIDEHNRQVRQRKRREAVIRKKLLAERKKELKRLGLEDEDEKIEVAAPGVVETRLQMPEEP
eukprot:Hpha_TRINITY_DN9494_c0_g1::TRINITY_DN9494_c0_g1_i1::g.139208::m.139208